MEWTLTISSQPLGRQNYGHNGENIQGTVSEQVSHMLSHIHINLISTPDEDQIAINAQAKSIKTPIVITTDTNGEPQIPSVTGADGNNTKTVQTALQDYCTAHISE